MKKVYTTMILVAFAISGFSQENIFIRVFNSAGSKIGKGHLTGTTDSSVILTKGSGTLEIKYTNIGFIKTKHSIGHSILVTSLVMGTIAPLVLLAANSTSGPGTRTNGWNFDIHFSDKFVFQTGLISGVLTGAAIGGIAGGLKTINIFIVNGHYENWQKARVKLDKTIYKAELR